MDLGRGAEEVLTLRPERFIPGGEALARVPEQPVTFVRGAIPEELVRVAVTSGKRQWRRGEVIEVLEASAHRRVPPCGQVAKGCGGCDWQHVAPEHQLVAKTQIAIDALSRASGLECDLSLVRAGGRVSPEGYRTTVRVRGDEQGRPGFFAHGSRRVVAADGCIVAHPGLIPVLERMRIAPGVEVSLRISATTGAITATWDGPRDAVQALGSEVGCGPDAAVSERVSGVDLRVSGGSFFQSGPEAAEVLVETVRRLAPEVATARHLVDAYAGIGLFSATLADAAAQITVIESSAPAVADARVNLAAWVEAGRADLHEMRMESWRPNLEQTAPGAHARGTAGPADVLIADPARQGLDRAGMGAVASAGAPVIVLISCDPASAARDLRLAADAGYALAAAEVLDLFPHTHHVEIVSRLEARRP